MRTDSSSGASVQQSQPLTFSEDMSYEQLAVWLTNLPKLVGYQQDINKLKGMSLGTYILVFILTMMILKQCNCRSQNKWFCISESG